MIIISYILGYFKLTITQVRQKSTEHTAGAGRGGRHEQNINDFLSVASSLQISPGWTEKYNEVI